MQSNRITRKSDLPKIFSFEIQLKTLEYTLKAKGYCLYHSFAVIIRSIKVYRHINRNNFGSFCKLYIITRIIKFYASVNNVIY